MPHEGMVHALRETRRVLKVRGVLIDLRPATIPMALEIVIGARAIWSKEVDSSRTPEDVAAADRAVQHAVSAEWFRFEKSLPYVLEIYCDSAVEFSTYAQNQKLSDAEIPYEELQKRLSKLATSGQKARMRCRRPWMLSAYRKK